MNLVRSGVYFVVDFANDFIYIEISHYKKIIRDGVLGWSWFWENCEKKKRKSGGDKWEWDLQCLAEREMKESTIHWSFLLLFLFGLALFCYWCSQHSTFARGCGLHVRTQSAGLFVLKLYLSNRRRPGLEGSIPLLTYLLTN